MNVLITGGTRGLGKELVYKYAKEGYNVIFNYVNSSDRALEIEKDVKDKFGVKCTSYKCDISNEEDVLKMFDEVKKEFNSIDVLVNNAAISCDNELSKKSVSEFKKVIDVNLVGTFIISKYFSQIMNKGSIINIVSNDGIDTCYKEEMDYAASKAGVISLTKTFAKELAPNIRVNAVAPGWMDTDMSKKDIDESELELEKEIILLKRFAKLEEVANVVFFLSSDKASYINGETIKVDGGY
jgi:3-oxoacyl-[acyl-carrier protein] reductase